MKAGGFDPDCMTPDAEQSPEDEPTAPTETLVVDSARTSPWLWVAFGTALVLLVAMVVLWADQRSDKHAAQTALSKTTTQRDIAVRALVDTEDDLKATQVDLDSATEQITDLEAVNADQDTQLATCKQAIKAAAYADLALAHTLSALKNYPFGSAPKLRAGARNLDRVNNVLEATGYRSITALYRGCVS